MDRESSRPQVAYDTLRNGFDDPSRMPAWADAATWIRDLALTSYLQGTLDAGDPDRFVEREVLDQEVGQLKEEISRLRAATLSVDQKAVLATQDAKTLEALTTQALAQHEHIRLLEEWMHEIISTWNTTYITPEQIDHGRFLLDDSLPSNRSPNPGVKLFGEGGAFDGVNYHGVIIKTDKEG